MFHLTHPTRAIKDIEKERVLVTSYHTDIALNLWAWSLSRTILVSLQNKLKTMKSVSYSLFKFYSP